MTALTVLAIMSFCLGLTGAIVGTLFYFMMVGEVNRKRDDANQIPYFNWPPGKQAGIYIEYRRLYPNGRLQIYIFGAAAVMAVGFGGAFLCLCLMGVLSPPPPSRPTGGGF
jgi:hypothetical protein